MSTHEVAIHEDTARRIGGVLMNFLSESAAGDALLIDRSGQLLAQGDSSRSLDTVSLSALAAGAFSSTAAMARLLGESEFTMLFHQGVKENIHVTAVDEDAILLATFDSRTTVGMVRLFAAEASAAIRAILAESRGRSCRAGALGGPLDTDEAQLMFRERAREGNGLDVQWPK
jgi:predicted regulator of Ras-like GTPase activity (Roadblock/LC7/MglB family)